MGLIVDTRDQDFVLYEMLGLEDLLNHKAFKDHSKDTVDMTLELSAKIAEEEVYPTFQKGDQEGAHFKDGKVTVPQCYKKLLKVMTESGLFITHIPAEEGGMGLPHLVDVASREHFVFNMGFLLYPDAAVGAAKLISTYGTEEQKRRYMDPMFAGQWGGTMVLTESEAGSDVGALRTKATLQEDGTYLITGSKIFISGGDSDLFDNIVHPVLARIEGDPEGTGGISIFLVPKYLVNSDGSLGEKNDFAVTGIEHKMGLKGSATCSMNFGDNNACVGELLGKPRQGMKIMFQMMNGARIGMGLQGLGTGSAAYLHALDYAKGRIQSTDIREMRKPDAKKVPIIRHPDVRRMLMEMKTTVEGLRAMVYFCAFADDKAHISEGDEKKKWQGLVDLMVPVVKAYGTDEGFKVTELAIQIYGGYGYTSDYPVEQMMRDMKIGSIYEGTNGIQSLDLVGRKLGLDNGAHFKTLLGMMEETLKANQANPELADLCSEFANGLKALGGAAHYFASSAKEGNPLGPVIKAYPFLNLMGTVMMGWFHLWQGGLAHKQLAEIAAEKKMDPADPKAVMKLAGDDKEAAYYLGKVQGALYFGRNRLPAVASQLKVIMNGDTSSLAIPESSF